jgi:hypothetical protein
MRRIATLAASHASRSPASRGFPQRASWLVAPTERAHLPLMFVVTEADAAAIRAVYELRQRFPGVTDNAQAQECARTIAGWKPLRPAG